MSNKIEKNRLRAGPGAAAAGRDNARRNDSSAGTRKRVGQDLENYNTIFMRVNGVSFTFHYPKDE